MTPTTLLKATLAADATALGYHWIYDVSLIPTLPKPLPMQAPESKFHKGLHAGDLTHYGAVLCCLLGSTLEKKEYNEAAFAKEMTVFWKDNTKYYVDGATKTFLAGDPPTSGEFSAVGRNAGILAVIDPAKDAEAFIAACKSQAALTHSTNVAVCAALFAEALTRLVTPGNTQKPSEVLKLLVTEASSPYALLGGDVEKGLASVGETTEDAVNRFGRSCSMDGCLSSCLHLIAKFEETVPCVANAVEASIATGGDSSSRVLPAVPLLAAYALRKGADPMDGLPDFAKIILPAKAKALATSL